MFTLGPFGQVPSVSTYTLLTLGFQLQDATQQDAVIRKLERAANDIVVAYPYLAGQVVIDKPIENKLASTGTFRIVEYQLHQGKSKFVHVKDCKNLCPRFAELVKSKAPSSMLDSRVISPAFGFANTYPDDVVKPVILVQANFIDGGVLLTICTHHCVMDANGNEQFIRQFAALCRDEELSKEDIRLGNADQNTIVPPIKPGEEVNPMEMFRCPSSLGASAGAWPPAPSSGMWKSFRFPQANITALKVKASALCSSDSEIKYISSNDAVTSFIWSRIAAVRSSWLPKGSTTMLIRAVNGRRKLDPPVSSGYMGHFILCSFTTLPLEGAITDSISSTAIAVRRSLLEVDDHQVRSFFHLLQTEKDRTTIAYGANMNPETDLMITSFAAQKLYETGFGEVLGKPEFVRRPDLPDGRGLFYLMPKTREGDIDLIACLTEEELQGLRKDKLWSDFAEFIG